MSFVSLSGNTAIWHLFELFQVLLAGLDLQFNLREIHGLIALNPLLVFLHARFERLAFEIIDKP